MLRRGFLWLACAAMIGCSGGAYEEECDENGSCPEGYSCRIKTCIENGSLSPGHPCTANEQCGVGDLCHDFSCYRACSGLLTVHGCQDGHYCDPVLFTSESCDADNPCPEGQRCRTNDEGDSACVYYQGLCRNGRYCDADAESYDCFQGEICVTFATGVSGCLSGCELDWSSGVYADNCGSSAEQAFTCTPVGHPSHARLACLDIIDPAVGPGSSCNPAYPNPCRPGLACLEGICKRLCDHLDAAGDSFCAAAEPGDICHVEPFDRYGWCDAP